MMGIGDDRAVVFDDISELLIDAVCAVENDTGKKENEKENAPAFLNQFCVQ